MDKGMIFPEQILSKIKESENGCLIWTACKHKKGYGFIQWKGKLRQAHRVVYELFNGELIKGLVIDHLCRTHDCVNPKHLEQVTCKVNINRGLTGNWQRVKTHCPKGHEYTQDNIYVHPDKGGRECQKCRRIREKARRDKCKMA
jgi:hypothetical protein